MVIKAWALKKHGQIDIFNPHGRDRERGVFLLLHCGGFEALIVDESGREHHEDLFSALPCDLRAQKVLGGGRYRRNSIKAWALTPKWEIDWVSQKYGEIDLDWREPIAKIITNNEQKLILT